MGRTASTDPGRSPGRRRLGRNRLRTDRGLPPPPASEPTSPGGLHVLTDLHPLVRLDGRLPSRCTGHRDSDQSGRIAYIELVAAVPIRKTRATSPKVSRPPTHSALALGLDTVRNSPYTLAAWVPERSEPLSCKRLGDRHGPLDGGMHRGKAEVLQHAKDHRRQEG